MSLSVPARGAHTEPMDPNPTRDFESLRAGLYVLRADVTPGATLTKLCTQQHGTGVLIPDPLNGICRTVRKACDAYLEFEPARLAGAMRLVRAPAETATRFFWPEVPGSSVLFPVNGFIAGFLSSAEACRGDRDSMPLVPAADAREAGPGSGGQVPVLRNSRGPGTVLGAKASTLELASRKGLTMAVSPACPLTRDPSGGHALQLGVNAAAPNSDR
jgi:hypothetical protein